MIKITWKRQFGTEKVFVSLVGFPLSQIIAKDVSVSQIYYIDACEKISLLIVNFIAIFILHVSCTCVFICGTLSHPKSVVVFVVKNVYTLRIRAPSSSVLLTRRPHRWKEASRWIVFSYQSIKRLVFRRFFSLSLRSLWNHHTLDSLPPVSPSSDFFLEHRLKLMNCCPWAVHLFIISFYLLTRLYFFLPNYTDPSRLITISAKMNGSVWAWQAMHSLVLVDGQKTCELKHFFLDGRDAYI